MELYRKLCHCNYLVDEISYKSTISYSSKAYSEYFAGNKKIGIGKGE